jgi:hypothetical protein
MCARVILALLAAALSSFNAWGQLGQNHAYTWSPTECGSCQSTIIRSNWFTDGTGLNAEMMSTPTAAVVASVTMIEGNFVVILGLQVAQGSSLTMTPREDVTLESDSAPHMVLYALNKPGPGVRKNEMIAKKQFKDNAVTLIANTPSTGSLFFPVDQGASQVTIVFTLGNETLRFPFVRDPISALNFYRRRRLSLEVPTFHQSSIAFQRTNRFSDGIRDSWTL